MTNINFDTVHINRTELINHNCETLEPNQQNKILINDLIDIDGPEKSIIFTFSTTNILKISHKTCIEITTVSKFEPHSFPCDLQTIEKMIYAHYFHSQVMLSEQLIINGYKELYLLPDNNSLEIRCRGSIKTQDDFLSGFER